VVATGAVRRAKLQSKCHCQQTNTQFFTGWMPFLSPNRVRALKGSKQPFTEMCKLVIKIFHVVMFRLLVL